MQILIIEDDLKLCEAMKEQLEQEGYDVDSCHDGTDATYYIEQMSYDILLLDRMLPGMDGLSIIDNMRKKGYNLPVIMVTAMNGLNDRVDGLDAGADDYLVKPFAMKELSARIRAMLRRPRQMGQVDLLSYGDLTFDPYKNLLTRQEKRMTLSKKEGVLMEFFLRNCTQVLSREQILSRVWGADQFVEDGNIDNYIHFLRRRLKSIESNVKIKTVYGVGYRMEAAE